MSLTYRLTAGLPALGVSVLAAVALGGAPASAAAADLAARPALPAATPAPCYDNDSRTKCNGGADGYGNGTGTATKPHGGGNAVKSTAPTDHRGQPGYGTLPTTAPPATTPPATSPTTAPTTAPPATPTANVDTVPPGTVSPTSSSPGYGPSTHGRGVSAGGVLPVTGPPMGPTIGGGAVLVALGGAAIWYTRRRRTA
jgi:hypothetical protein